MLDIISRKFHVCISCIAEKLGTRFMVPAMLVVRKKLEMLKGMVWFAVRPKKKLCIRSLLLEWRNQS